MTQFISPSERGQWFDTAIAAVLDQAHVVLEAQHPRALERLTSQLIGAQLHQVLVAEKTGLWFDRWFVELVSATESRVREQADGGAWEAPFRLLHGLAAIGTPGCGADRARGRQPIAQADRPGTGQDPGPRWPLDVRRLMANGDVARLRDAWGTRYAVIAGFSYGGRDRSVFLFDVDTDFYNIVVSAGDFDDTEQAAAAWRHKVGDAAGDARVQPVEHVDQLDCLVHLDMDEAALPAIPDRSVIDNWFAAQRRLAELRTALRRAGTPPTVAASLYRVDADPAVDEFAQWYHRRHGAEPDREAAEALADEWMSGVIPETRSQCLARRVAQPVRADQRLDRRRADSHGDRPAPGLGDLARRTRPSTPSRCAPNWPTQWPRRSPAGHEPAPVGIQPARRQPPEASFRPLPGDTSRDRRHRPPPSGARLPMRACRTRSRHRRRRRFQGVGFHEQALAFVALAGPAEADHDRGQPACSMRLPGAFRVAGREEDEVVKLGAAQAVRLVVLHEEQARCRSWSSRRTSTRSADRRRPGPAAGSLAARSRSAFAGGEVGGDPVRAVGPFDVRLAADAEPQPAAIPGPRHVRGLAGR